MSVYLRDIPLPEARRLLETALKESGLWGLLGKETIALDENALGRVLADPVWARISSPHYHASAMDGFSVRAVDTIGAGPSTPLTLRLGSAAHYIDTGDALPEGFDAVIPIENVEPLDIDGVITGDLRHPYSIRIRAALTPWSHVRPLGEDMVATQLVFPSGHILRPVDLGALAAAGHQQVIVAYRPRVAVLPTGTELVPIGSVLKPGQILEYNSLVMAAQVHAWGGEARRFPIIPDDLNAICDRVKDAAQDSDLILLNAGSSAGSEDFSAQVVEKLGMLLVHGVAVRPGHPVILGLVRREESKNGSLATRVLTAYIPIIGVPGYPVSAALTGEIFVEPLLAHWTGRRPRELPVEKAYLTRKITSPAGDDDFVRVAVGKVGEKILATPLSRGAGVISSLVRADGLVIFPSGVQGADAGDEVDIHLYRSISELVRTIFCIGSHDMILDLLAQYLSGYDRRLTSTNVGSQAGLIALKRGEAHLAGSHLLDPQTGEYNIPYLSLYLPGIPVRLVALVGREQGLLVQRGNPMGVKSLSDLARSNQKVRFINRQSGAGTRLLLDYHLKKMEIPPEGIQGYNQEEYTHLGVAAAVASGRADCGLGIAAAAQALDLDFIPLFKERYDLVIPKEYFESELLAPIFNVIADNNFRNEVSRMPGYDVTVMGKLIAEVNY